MKLIYKVVHKIRRKLTHWYMANAMKKGRGKKLTVSIRDMFYVHMRGHEFLRLDMVVRYLTVKAYYNEASNGSFGFDLYRKMQDARKGEGYSDIAVEKFQNLIESYQANGYDTSSRIVVDKNLLLKDGSHRLALGIYHGEDKISVLALSGEDSARNFSVDWFYQNGFTNDEIDLILAASNELSKKMEIAFTGVIWSPANCLRDEILSDLKRFGVVSDVKMYSYSAAQYENIVRKIYSIDDIVDWKIDAKLEHMRGFPPRLTMFHIVFAEPMFRVKAATNMPISQTVERTKMNIRERYKDKVENYFFDTILHIADNDLQSRFMDRVFEPKLNFAGLVDSLNQYDCAFVKTDVPYMSEDFPDKIPVGKDADIVCSKEHFTDIKNTVIQQMNQGG